MKKLFLSVLIVILTITFALAATDHDAQKNKIKTMEEWLKKKDKK